MRKYLAVARAEWLDSLQNREEILLWVFIEALPVFIFCSLWVANRSHILSLNISQLVTYYLVIFIISRLTSFYFDEHLQEEIRDGSFSRYLLRPFSVPLTLIFQNLGGKIFNTFTILLPVLVFLILIFHSYLTYPTSLHGSLFIISLVVAYLIQFYLSLMVVTGAFFIEQAFGLIHARWVLDTVAGGYSLPLFLYPAWAQRLVSFLPFKYIYFIPASIYTGTLSLSESLVQILYSLIWVIILYLLSRYLWKTGLTRYSSVGG